MDELNDFFLSAKAELIRANQDRRHDFRLLTLISNGTFPEARTVVKRKTTSDLDTLIYTDSRSEKVKQLIEDARCTQMFYHQKKKIQIIIKGEAELILEGDLFEKHKDIALKNPKDYSTLKPPATQIDDEIYQYGEDVHFCLIKIEAISLEVLKLGDPKHRRAIFFAQEEWKGTWLVP